VVESLDCVCSLNNYKPPFSRVPWKHNSCISLNSEAAHGVPSKEKIIGEEDVVKVDLVVGHNGWNVDAATTFSLNQGKMRELNRVRTAFDYALGGLRPLDKISRWGQLITDLTPHPFFILKELYGHGIGRNIHEKPDIPNYIGGAIDTFEVGRMYAIETIWSNKPSNITLSPDGWTIECEGDYAVHFEETILILPDKIEILTGRTL
jgi:methionyl aminopeptidase